MSQAVRLSTAKRFRFSARHIAIGLWWVVCIGALFVLYRTHPNGAGDYFAYDDAAAALMNNTPVYSGVDGAHPYLYPPLLAISLVPIVALVPDIQTRTEIWFLLNLGALIVGVTLLLQVTRSSRVRLAIALLAPVYAPVLMALFDGQVTVILFLLMVGAWRTVKQERPELAGILLAVAAWIKIYPALLLGLFVLLKNWRLLRAALGTAVLLGIAQLVAVGPATSAAFVTETFLEMSTSGQPFTYHANVALAGFFGRLFLPHALVNSPFPESAALFTLSRITATLALVVLTAVAVRRSSIAGEQTFDLQYALAVVTMILITPSIFTSGLVILLLVYVALLNAPIRRIIRTRIIWFCLLTLLLSPVDTATRFSIPETNRTPISAWTLSTTFFILVGLYGLLVVLLWSWKRFAAPGGSTA